MTIKAGDLCMVVKPRICCGDASGIGYIFTAKDTKSRTWYCQACGAGGVQKNRVLCEDGVSIEISRLIKIDPPALQGETEESKELTA